MYLCQVEFHITLLWRMQEYAIASLHEQGLYKCTDDLSVTIKLILAHVTADRALHTLYYHPRTKS